MPNKNIMKLEPTDKITLERVPSYLEVTDSGIMEISKESPDGILKIGKIIIPREIFKEAYEKYCKEE